MAIYSGTITSTGPITDRNEITNWQVFFSWVDTSNVTHKDHKIIGDGRGADYEMWTDLYTPLAIIEGSDTVNLLVPPVISIGAGLGTYFQQPGPSPQGAF